MLYSIGEIMTTPKSNSLLRRFSIFYVGFALIPIIILFSLDSLYDETRIVLSTLGPHENFYRDLKHYLK